jgi:hypothetical protein
MASQYQDRRKPFDGCPDTWVQDQIALLGEGATVQTLIEHLGRKLRATEEEMRITIESQAERRAQNPHPADK